MLPILIFLAVAVVVACLVLFYVAFPHRGQKPPQGEWLGDMMTRASDAVPVLDEADGEALRHPDR